MRNLMVKKMTIDDVALCGYEFSDPDLFILALTHRSAAMVAGRHNERLEFLGDAILGLIISEFLFEKFPHATDAEMSTNKANLASRKTMAAIGRVRKWRKFISVGKSIRANADLPDSIYANVGEALIAAIYLDGGYAEARNFVFRLFADYLTNDSLDLGSLGNFKQQLAKRVAREMFAPVTYQVLETAGADHQKNFRVGAFIGPQLLGIGEGASKKDAEQNAARVALDKIPSAE